jgi:hypothetical protein
VLSHHPIGINPNEAALSPLDVSTLDWHRLKRVLAKAEHTGQVLPRRPKPLWGTEFWWISNPPNPTGVPIWRQARWIEQTFFLLWKQGVSVAINLPIEDAHPGPATLQSGIYFLSGEPKPSATAFRFPLVAHREHGRTLVWGIAPESGMVQLQKKRGGGWVTIARVRSQGAPHPFEFWLRDPAKRRVTFRAQQRHSTSLPWVQF